MSENNGCVILGVCGVTEVDKLREELGKRYPGARLRLVHTLEQLQELAGVPTRFDKVLSTGKVTEIWENDSGRCTVTLSRFYSIIKGVRSIPRLGPNNEEEMPVVTNFFGPM